MREWLTCDGDTKASGTWEMRCACKHLIEKLDTDNRAKPERRASKHLIEK